MGWRNKSYTLQHLQHWTAWVRTKDWPRMHERRKNMNHVSWNFVLVKFNKIRKGIEHLHDLNILTGSDSCKLDVCPFCQSSSRMICIFFIGDFFYYFSALVNLLVPPAAFPYTGCASSLFSWVFLANAPFCVKHFHWGCDAALLQHWSNPTTPRTWKCDTQDVIAMHAAAMRLLIFLPLLISPQVFIPLCPPSPLLHPLGS